MRFPFACLANKRRTVVLTPGYNSYPVPEFPPGCEDGTDDQANSSGSDQDCRRNCRGDVVFCPDDNEYWTASIRRLYCRASRLLRLVEILGRR